LLHSGIKTFLTFIRFPVSFAVTLSAFTAGVVFYGDFSSRMILPVAGIFLLAAGASAMNQFQERNYDALMERTKRRPLPAGRITPSIALSLSLLLIISGLLILLVFSTLICFILGLINILWYNGLYTELKRKTAFAVIPGALTGVIPVLMGWTSAGGRLDDPVILFLALFLFFWRMPHFWLLMMKYGQDYRQAGFPVLTDIFDDNQVKRLTMVWLVASSFCSMMLVFFGIFLTLITGGIIILLNIILLILIFYQLFFASLIRFRLIFIAANLFMSSVLICLIVDRLMVQG